MAKIPYLPTIVVAIATTGVGYNGEVITVREGEAWDARDPFVRRHPELFSGEPTARVRRTRPYVEQATANPGELR